MTFEPAGAGLYDARAGNWWAAALRTKIHHLCRIKVNGSRSMRLEVVSLNGRIIELIDKNTYKDSP